MNTGTADMIACAYNNFSRKPEKVVVMPQVTIAANEEFWKSYEKNWGFTVVAVEKISGETLIAAMDEFAAETDWRGWKRRDWNAAYATLRN